MIDIWQRVSQVTALHQWYTQQIDANNLAAISRASVQSSITASPKTQQRNLRQRVESDMSPMIGNMITEASSDAILMSLRDERFDMTDEEAARVEMLTEAYMDHLEAVVRNQLRLDEHQANKRHQQFWLQVELSQYREGISRSQAIVKERENTLIGASTRMDSRGRAWKSSRYLQVETMSKLTDLFNAIAIYLLGRRGWEEVQVHNPGHPNHERKFMLKDYDKVEAEYFHPNSPALITKVIY